MYEEKKNNKTKTAQKDTADAIRKIVSKMYIEHTMNQFGDDADSMLGWLAHRAGNQEPIRGHKLDKLRMIVDNDCIQLMYPETDLRIMVDDGKLTVENLRETVRLVIEHDQETLWNISCKIADEMMDEDDED
jgi:hypothetical protein